MFPYPPTNYGAPDTSYITATDINKLANVHYLQFTTYVEEPIAFQYHCIYCFDSFQYNSELTEHLEDMCEMQTDTFNCPGCSQYFTSREYLDEHIIEYHFLTHIGFTISSYFECNYCSYRTISKLRIRSHVQNRIIQHAYVCCVCHYVASNKCDSILHYATQHQLVNFLQCYVCRRSFMSKQEYDLHILFEHLNTDAMKYITLCQWPFNPMISK